MQIKIGNKNYAHRKYFLLVYMKRFETLKIYLGKKSFSDKEY